MDRPGKQAGWTPGGGPVAGLLGPHKIAPTEELHVSYPYKQVHSSKSKLYLGPTFEQRLMPPHSLRTRCITLHRRCCAEGTS